MRQPRPSSDATRLPFEATEGYERRLGAIEVSLEPRAFLYDDPDAYRAGVRDAVSTRFRVPPPSAGRNSTPVNAPRTGAARAGPRAGSANEFHGRGLEDGKTTHLEEFLALVAHEVRTPLAVAKGAATNLRRLGAAGDEGTREKMVAMIERHIDLASLLMGRMALARDVEQGNVRLNKKPVDLARLVRESVGDLQLAILSDHPVDITSVPTLVVEADPTAAREILFNVLSNAAKYSACAARIEIAVGRQDHIGQVVVRDHGTGVTPGDTDRIFGKFFQGDSHSPGVGLGLFVSRGLARAHGGDLTVRPAARSGSEFVLELPADPPKQPPAATQQAVTIPDSRTIQARERLNSCE